MMKRHCEVLGYQRRSRVNAPSEGSVLPGTKASHDAQRHAFAPLGWAVPRSMVLDRCATTVGSDDRAGHIACVRRGEEGHDLGDLLDGGGALEQGRGS